VAADSAALVRAAEQQGGLHVLVLSAAVELRADLEATSDEAWQDVLDVNLKGPFLCMRAGIPAIARAGGGAVVALGSTLGAIGQPGFAAYCSAKGALVNLCKQAAIESAADGVRVNVVAPSACDTGLFVRTAARSGAAATVMRQVAENIPMQRLGTAAEVCAAVLFLASDAAAYISGTVLPLDGGLAARRQ
jgi:NAD(P)-dependent dehydrogenase (short-subunit alcohol dehydrogenase family)